MPQPLGPTIADEFAAGDGEVDAIERANLSLTSCERLGHAAQFERGAQVWPSHRIDPGFGLLHHSTIISA